MPRNHGSHGSHASGQQRSSRVRFDVHVQPRASRTELAGRRGDALRIRLAAPPVEGAANAELISFLAGLLGVPKSSVRIVRGGRSRTKTVEVRGITTEAVRAALALSE